MSNYLVCISIVKLELHLEVHFLAEYVDRNSPSSIYPAREKRSVWQDWTLPRLRRFFATFGDRAEANQSMLDALHRSDGNVVLEIEWEYLIAKIKLRVFLIVTPPPQLC